jgi:hypothetical protein
VIVNVHETRKIDGRGIIRSRFIRGASAPAPQRIREGDGVRISASRSLNRKGSCIVPPRNVIVVVPHR